MSSVSALQKKRNVVFQARFSLPASEELTADFLCALQQKILLQGRLYISQHYVCFYAKVFGAETALVIPAADITGVSLAKSLGIVPNAIKLYTTYNVYWLGSFLKRQEAYALLMKVSKGEKLSKDDIVMDVSKTSNASNDPAGGEADERELSQRQDREDRRGGEEEDAEEEKPKRRKAKTTPVKAKGKASARQRQAGDDEMEAEDREADEDRDAAAAADADDGRPRRGKAAAGAGKKKMNGRSPVKTNGRQKPSRPPPSDDEAERDEDGTGERKEQEADQKAAGDSGSDINEDDEILNKLRNAAKRKGQGASPSNNIVLLPPVTVSSTPSPAPTPPVPPAQPGKKRKGDYTDIYLCPPVDTPTDPKVDSLATRIRKQPSALSISAPGRLFIYEGPMRRQGRWSVVDRWVFLFSDVLVLSKQTDRDRWEMKQWLPLNGLTVDCRPAELQPTMRKTKLPQPFRLIYTPPALVPPPNTTPPPLVAPAAEYTVSTDTKEQQSQWTQRLLLAIAAHHFNCVPVAPPAAEAVSSAFSPSLSYRPFGWYYRFVLGGIHQAVYDNDAKQVEALCKADEDIIDTDDMEGRGVLHICAAKNDATMIPLLLQLGADVKKKDRDGYTAMHIAAREGNLATLNALLASTTVEFEHLHNGDKSPKQYRDMSSVWLCVLSAQLEWQECLNILLSLSKPALRRQTMDDRDDDGQTLLEAACAAGLTRAIAVLVKQGATIDLPNRQGLTPLSLAAKRGNQELVRELIAQGAQPNLRFIPQLSSPLLSSATADVANLLLTVGARPTLKNAKGVRLTDLFRSESAAATFQQAEEAHAARPPVDTDDHMHPQATTHAQNNSHTLDSCVLCQEEFTIVRKRDYCRRCGLNVCQADSSKKLIFRRKRNGKKERVLARVCDGCYNIVLFRQREDGGIGMETKNLKLKKKRPAAGDGDREVSRKGAPSQSRKWEEVDAEDEDDDGGGGGKDERRGGHSRDTSVDDASYESPVEDGASVASTMKSLGKKGMRGAWKMGGLIGGKLSHVFDNVSDGLTNMAIPKGAQRRGGAVNDMPAEAGQEEGDEDEREAEEAEGEDVRPTPTKRTAAVRRTTTTTTVSETVERGKASGGRSNAKAEGTSSAVSKAKRQASANLQQMHQQEERSSEILEEAETFGGLSAKLKAKAKRGAL